MFSDIINEICMFVGILAWFFVILLLFVVFFRQFASQGEPTRKEPDEDDPSIYDGASDDMDEYDDTEEEDVYTAPSGVLRVIYAILSLIGIVIWFIMTFVLIANGTITIDLLRYIFPYI